MKKPLPPVDLDALLNRHRPLTPARQEYQHQEAWRVLIYWSWMHVNPLRAQAVRDQQVGSHPGAPPGF